MSGAKKPSARDSIAMRGPSRQITAALMAGGDAPAAMARARSAMTRPSAPSAMPASVSGRPGLSRVAGDWAEILRWRRHRSLLGARVKGLELAQHGGVVVAGMSRLAADPGIEVGIRHFDQPLEIVQRRLVECVDMGIGKAADDQIGLAHAAPPGPEQKLLAAAHPGLRSIVPSWFGSRKRRKPGRGRGSAAGRQAREAGHPVASGA